MYAVQIEKRHGVFIATLPDNVRRYAGDHMQDGVFVQAAVHHGDRKGIMAVKKLRKIEMKAQLADCFQGRVLQAHMFEQR